MTRPLIHAAQLALMLLSFAAVQPVTAADFDPTRYLHAILSAQEGLAQGIATAPDAHVRSLASASNAFLNADRSVWGTPRGRRTLLMFGLVGGDSRIVRKLLVGATMSEQEQGLVNGYIDTSAGTEAKSTSIEALIVARRSLSDPLLSAALALHIAPLIAASRPAYAHALLDEARLEAPGTLIEETALRRQITLALRSKDVSLGATLIGRYVKRFANSAFKNGHLDQTSLELVQAMRDARNDAVVSMLNRIGELPSASLFQALLCRDLLLAGRLEAAGALIASLRPEASETLVISRRRKICVAAAHILDLGGVARVKTLAAEITDHLPDRDRQLLDLAVTAASQLSDGKVETMNNLHGLGDKHARVSEADAPDLLLRARNVLMEAEKTWLRASR